MVVGSTDRDRDLVPAGTLNGFIGPLGNTAGPLTKLRRRTAGL